MRTEPGESALPAEAKRGRSPAFRDNTRVSLVSPLVARAFARGAGRARNERQTEFPLADRRLLRESGATTRPSRAALLEGCFQYVTSRHARRASDTHTDTPSEGELSPPTFRRISAGRLALTRPHTAKAPLQRHLSTSGTTNLDTRCPALRYERLPLATKQHFNGITASHISAIRAP